MTTRMRDHYNSRETSQSMPIPGREAEMSQNNAGGFTFTVDMWTQLDRFLILGSEGGNYYATEQKLTVDNAKSVQKCIAKDGLRVVARIVEISDSGRAAKNDPALFALALCSAADKVEVRKAALDALPKVARIGTHLFHFAHFVEGFRGWGRALRKAIANWYDKPADRLAVQAVKYQQRDGWSHRDLLRLSHPRTDDPAQDAVYRWITGGMDAVNATSRKVRGDNKELIEKVIPSRAAVLPAFINAYEEMKALDEKDVKGAIRLINDFNLPREAVKTEFLNDVNVWDALLNAGNGMPMTAMIRNLGKMSSIGLLKPMSDATRKIVDTLNDVEKLHAARIHPFNVLVALKMYSMGHGLRGSLTWDANGTILDALDGAFYASFKNVEPTGGNTLIGVDCSGSMCCNVMGTEVLSCRDAAAALALVTANVEDNYDIVGFSSGNGWTQSGNTSRSRWGGSGIKTLGITPKMRLDTVVEKMARFDWGGTDCALPALYAEANNMPVDNIVIITDNETWAGDIQPTQALKRLRQKVGRPTRQVVVGMSTNGFSIADPKDSGQLDLVGFDSNGPAIMNEFFKGNI